MSEQPIALRLADELERAVKHEDADDQVISVARWFVDAAAAELRRLVAENEALRADAERYRWLREYLISHQLLWEMFCTPDRGAQPDYWWVLWPSYAVDRRKAPLGYATTPDAAIDSAIRGALQGARHD